MAVAVTASSDVSVELDMNLGHQCILPGAVDSSTTVNTEIVDNF